MNPQRDDKPANLIPADIYAPGPVQTAPQSAPSANSPLPPHQPTGTGSTSNHLPHLPMGPKNGWRPVISTVLLFLLAPIIALCIAAFVIQSYQVDGESMETTLQNNDRLIVDKIPRTLSRLTHHAYVPARGNIIIFNQSGLPDSGPTGEKQLIKRVIGLPGDHVVIQNGYITIYNKVHPQGFNPDKTTGYTIAATTTPGDIDLTLPANEIFVCGDNRPNSEDSRFFGPVNVNQIVGQLVLRLLPAGHIEKF